MSKDLRDMVDSIADENFDEARSALKASLADYMAGKKFLTNEDVFGSDYGDPRKEGIEESEKSGFIITAMNGESVDGKVYETEDEAYEALDDLVNSPDWSQYVDEPDELDVEEV